MSETGNSVWGAVRKCVRNCVGRLTFRVGNSVGTVWKCVKNCEELCGTWR